MTDYNAKLGHVELEVRDLDRAASFYRRFLGLEIRERMDSRKGRVIFLSAGDRHHDVALTSAPGRSYGPPPPEDGSGPDRSFQLGFELAEEEAFAELYYRLRADGVPATAVDHGISWSLYFRDPDGYPLEAYWDTRGRERGRDRWEGDSRLLALGQVLREEQIERLKEMRREEAAARESGEEPPEEPADPTGSRSGTED